jgi:hypothetical protein
VPRGLAVTARDGEHLLHPFVPREMAALQTFSPWSLNGPRVYFTTAVAG